MSELNDFQPVHRRRSVEVVSDEVLDRFPRTKIPTGIELLFDGDWEPIDIVNNFLLSRVRSKIRSRKRWRNTNRSDADDMAQFLIYLWAIGVKLEDVTSEHIDGYNLNIVQGVSVWTSKPLANESVSRRMVSLRNFCDYAFDKGYYKTKLVALKSSRRASVVRTGEGELLVERADTEIERPDLPKPDETIRPLSKIELARTLDHLGPKTYQPGGRSIRDRLAAEVAVVTGLRVSEIVGLTVNDIADMRRLAEGRDKFVKIWFWIGQSKGNKRRRIAVPVYLIDRLQHYLDTERAEIVSYRASIQDGESVDSALFLNSLNSNHRDLGKGTAAGTISASFSKAVFEAGFMTRHDVFVLDGGLPTLDPKTGKALKKSVFGPAHSFHDLRHTFAIQLYLAKKLGGDKNPLSAVKAQLGHTLSQTTADTYLAWVDIFENEISDELSNFYDLVAEMAA